MDPFCISSSVLGSDRHIIVSDDGYNTTLKVPKDMWVFNGALDPLKPLCLDSLLKLKGIEISIKPESKWTRLIEHFIFDSAIVPWSQVMPAIAYKSFVKNLIKSIVDSIDELPKDYYKSVWGPIGQFLVGLKAANIDSVGYRSSAAILDRDSGAFETFRPGQGGYLQPVIYDRFATRTGRLVVSSGPNILTLKREHRKLLKSSFQSGKICSLDFGALEARIILLEAGVTPSINDLYAEIATNLFDKKVDRDTVKIAVISELYGSSKRAIGLRLGLAGKMLEDFIELIQSYFKTANLRKRLKEEFIQTGKIRNRFGRPLDLDDPQDHLFINTYTQSTGVDVSLLGFKKIADDLGLDGIRPLFVLHDALILDVRSDRIKDVENYMTVSIPTYEHQFPLKFEMISE